MGKSKVGKVLALGLELDPKKVLKMEPDERASWFSDVCRFASDGIVSQRGPQPVRCCAENTFKVFPPVLSRLYNVLSSEKFGDGLSEKAAKRMNRTMLKHLHLFSEKQQRYLKQLGLVMDETETSKDVADYKSARRKGSDEDAAARMEDFMMARCRNFVREKADTFEERMKEAEEREQEARRQERLRQEQERKERLAREWAAITEWHAPMESWEELQLSLEDFRTQERAQMEEEVRRALRKTKGSRSRSKRKRSPVVGKVVEWKKTHGWIEPECSIEHPDIGKHQGHIFVHGEDIVPKWRGLVAGSMVEFILYLDGHGLGAEECIARKVLRVTLAWKHAQETLHVPRQENHYCHY
eukprot:g10762.t1